MRYLNHIFKIFDISKYRLLVRSRLIWSRSDRLFPVHFRLISAIRIIWQKIYCWDQWHPKLDILKHFRQLNSELFVVMRLSDISILTATSTTFFNYVHFRTTVSHFTSKIHVFDLLKAHFTVEEIQWFEISWAADPCRPGTMWLQIETFNNGRS